MSMSNRSRMEKSALKLVANALKAEGWKVNKIFYDECSYTAPKDSTHMVTIRPYARYIRGLRLWRCEVSGYFVPSTRGTKGQDFVNPTRLTVFKDELMVCVDWLVQWIMALDAGKELPGCPVELETNSFPAGEDTWSIKAIAEYDRMNKRREQAAERSARAFNRAARASKRGTQRTLPRRITWNKQHQTAGDRKELT